MSLSFGIGALLKLPSSKMPRRSKTRSRIFISPSERRTYQHQSISIIDESDDEFPPEKRLEASNYRLVKAGIETIPDMETLQECVAYESAHQNRTQILPRLKWKAEELREGEE